MGKSSESPKAKIGVLSLPLLSASHPAMKITRSLCSSRSHLLVVFLWDSMASASPSAVAGDARNSLMISMTVFIYARSCSISF